MPTIQHSSVKFLIKGLRTSIRNKKSDIIFLRNSLEFSTMFKTLPWRVQAIGTMLNHLQADWIIPESASKEKVILYFHGGGYNVGSSYTHRSMVGKIAKESGAMALLVNYRLAPEHPFPAAVEDTYFSYKWLLMQGYKPGNIVIAGDSAGGGLTLSTMLMIKNSCLPMPSAGICLSPWVDLANTGGSLLHNKKNDPLLCSKVMSSWVNNYASGYDKSHPLISPIFGDFKGFPPLLIQASEVEMLFDDATGLAEIARDAGVEVTLSLWPQMMHWWQMFWQVVPEANKALSEIGSFIRKRWGNDTYKSGKIIPIGATAEQQSELRLAN